jgi:hypothetical protein
MTMADAMELFHLSRKDAANHLNISSSSLKRLCNRNGGHRWPARRVRFYLVSYISLLWICIYMWTFNLFFRKWGGGGDFSSIYSNRGNPNTTIRN